ncbi:MAG: lysophospholipid acyltransferase family protein [Acidimicrobiia bacterium]
MLKRMTRGLLRVFGWRVEGVIPPHPKMVVIGAPHTSNWDFPLAMLAAPALGLRIRWLGKHTLFKKPFGWFFRMLGGIPVDRSKAAGVIRQSVAAFDAAEELALVITPEGTRSKRDHWKSGFYRIARDAGVPLVLVGVDGANKTVRVGPSFVPSGEVGADMDRIRQFYAGYGGVKPDRVGPIRLRDED